MAKSQDRTKFDLFVREFGVEALAHELDVNPSAIYHWLRGATSPYRANAEKIEDIAKKRGVLLSLNEIYDHYHKVRSARYRSHSLKPQRARA
jgi:hypothetical protein